MAVTARTIIRIRTRRFGLDDYFVLLAIITLSGATGVTLNYTRELFLVEAMTRNRAYVFTTEDVKSFGSVALIVVCLPPFTWTATFAVKFSFLVLFRELIKRISKRITIYIWVVILFTVLAWAFALSHPFIGCPHTNDPSKLGCMVASRRTLILDFTLVSLDMGTDVMSDFYTILFFRLKLLRLS